MHDDRNQCLGTAADRTAATPPPRHHRHGCVVIVGGENEQAVRECCREMSLDKKQTDRVCRESRRIARKHRKFADSHRRSCPRAPHPHPEQFGQWRKTMAPSEDMRMIHVDRPADTRNGNDYRGGPKGPLCANPSSAAKATDAPHRLPHSRSVSPAPFGGTLRVCEPPG